MKYLLFVLLLVAVLITAGCMSQPQAPTTTISYNVVVPTDTIQTVPTVPTVPTVRTIAKPIPPVPKPTLIDYTGKSGWVSYTNYDDHFRIYKPSDWTVSEIDKSEMPNDGKMDTSLIMDKFVYISTPDMTGFITIYGVDFSGTLYSIFNDPAKTQISDELYDGFVNGINSGETDKVKITSIEKDSNYYMINGNPARCFVLHWQINGKPLSGDSYIIAHVDTYYVEIYSAMAGSSQADASTASNIMRTFTTTSTSTSTSTATATQNTQSPNLVASPSTSQYNSAAALYSKSVDLANAGKYSEALQASDQALVQNVPSLIPLIQANRAGILVMLGRYEEANAAADFAIATSGTITTTRSIAYYNKGDALRHLGRIEEAKVAYAKAAELDPTLTNPYQT